MKYYTMFKQTLELIVPERSGCSNYKIHLKINQRNKRGPYLGDGRT